MLLISVQTFGYIEEHQIQRLKILGIKMTTLLFLILGSSITVALGGSVKSNEIGHSFSYEIVTSHQIITGCSGMKYSSGETKTQFYFVDATGVRKFLHHSVPAEVVFPSPTGIPGLSRKRKVYMHEMCFPTPCNAGTCSPTSSTFGLQQNPSSLPWWSGGLNLDVGAHGSAGTSLSQNAFTFSAGGGGSIGASTDAKKESETVVTFDSTAEASAAGQAGASASGENAQSEASSSSGANASVNENGSSASASSNSSASASAGGGHTTTTSTPAPIITPTPPTTDPPTTAPTTTTTTGRPTTTPTITTTTGRPTTTPTITTTTGRPTTTPTITTTTEKPIPTTVPPCSLTTTTTGSTTTLPTTTEPAPTTTLDPITTTTKPEATTAPPPTTTPQPPGSIAICNCTAAAAASASASSGSNSTSSNSNASTSTDPGCGCNCCDSCPVAKFFEKIALASGTRAQPWNGPNPWSLPNSNYWGAWNSQFSPSQIQPTWPFFRSDRDKDSSPNSDNKIVTDPKYYAGLPGAIRGQAPVIYYPSCDPDAYFQPAIINYCTGYDTPTRHADYKRSLPIPNADKKEKSSVKIIRKQHV